ncbi:hypothetical protein HN51_052331 [Arachis hypogaea]
MNKVILYIFVNAFRQRVKEVKSAIRQSRRSMPINGYEARVVMALLQCVETLQGDLKVAIKEDKDWYSRFMPLTEVIMKFVVNRSLVKMIEQIEEEQYNGIDVYSLFSDSEGGKEEYWDGYHSSPPEIVWAGRDPKFVIIITNQVINNLSHRKISFKLREQHCWYSPDLSLVATTSSSKLGRESFIDLNLPALAEEDDASQFEDSAVSDAEFVNPVKYSFLPSLPQTSFQSCWVTRAYLLDIGYVDSIHSNLPPAIYPTKGDTYTIQFASTIQNLPMLSLLLEMYLTFVTAFVAEPLDYRAFASMLGHYSFAYPGALHSLLPNSETVVVDKKITKYQADEYILTLPISFVQRAFGTKPDQVDVGDDAGLCYKADVRSKPSRPRECYFARG